MSCVAPVLAWKSLAYTLTKYYGSVYDDCMQLKDITWQRLKN